MTTPIPLGPELESAIARLADAFWRAQGPSGPLLTDEEIRRALTDLATAAYSAGRIEGGITVGEMLGVKS